MPKLEETIGKVKSGEIKIDFDRNSKLKAIIIKNGSLCNGYVINEEGEIVCTSKMGAISSRLTTCKKLIDNYLLQLQLKK